MKFLISLLFIFTSFSNAFWDYINPIPWSSMELSSIGSHWDNLNEWIEGKTDEIQSYWKNEISQVLIKIAIETKKKEQKLKIIKKLEAEINKSNKEILFLLEKEKQLLGNEANVKGIKNN